MQSDVRFTQAQKWDLLRMSGAAVVSTVFFGIPMFMARPEVVPAGARPADTRQTADVSVLVAETVAPVTTPALEALPSRVVLHVPARRGVARAPLQSRERRQLAPASGRPLARRHGRLLTGSGRHEVRPFPSLDYLR
jgi:hypothetical protein